MAQPLMNVNSDLQFIYLKDSSKRGNLVHCEMYFHRSEMLCFVVGAQLFKEKFEDAQKIMAATLQKSKCKLIKLQSLHSFLICLFR